MALSIEEQVFLQCSWQKPQNNCEEFSDLHLACKKGHIKTVRKLISEGWNLSSVIPSGLRKGCTPLHIAVENEQIEIVKLLLNSGADIYLPNENGSTPLHLAFEYRSIPSKLLIMLKMDKVNEYRDVVNDQGLSIFHIVCSTDEVNMVEKFLSNRVDLNHQVKHYSKYRGNTALHFACSNSCAKTVKYLLENGADFTLKNANNETPLHIALKIYCDKAVRLILKAYFTVCSKMNKNIKGIFEKNNIATYININPSERFLENFRPLHFAVKFQLLEIIKILIENGIDVGAKDSSGMTALHYAVQDTQMGLLQEDYLDMCLQSINSQDDGEIDTFSQRLIKIIDLLLKSGCDVNAVDIYGRPPLFFLYDRLSQRALLKAPENYKNPLRSSSMGSRTFTADARRSIIRLLFSYSPALDVQDLKGNTILHLMATTGNSFFKFEAEVVEEYLKNGGDVNVLNNGGYSALYYTCGNGHTEMMNLLLQHGADVNLTRAEDMERPLHRAVRFLRGSQFRGRCRYKFDIVEELLKRGAYLDVATTNGMTPILLATNPLITSGTSNNLLIMCLLNWGCNLNCSDSAGRTPLHYICKHKNLPMLEVFLRHGADINAVDHHGNTPFSLVRKSNRFSLVDSLIMFSYLKRLTILGVEMCFTNRKLYEHHGDVVNMCDGVKDKLGDILTDEQCKTQLEYMKTVYVDSYTTLYDILRRNTNSLTHHVNNEKLSEIFWDPHFDDDYSVYGYLLKIKMKNAKKRAVLLEPAKESLLLLLKFDMPEACFQNILSHLGISDLKNLIRANVGKKKIDETEDELARENKRPRLCYERFICFENSV